MGKKINNNLQDITQKTKNQVTQTPLKTGGERSCCSMISSSCPTSDNRRGFI